MSKTLRNLPGFTLIELLVVIAIIGILASLLMANFAGIRDRADDAKKKGDLKHLQTALRLYYNDHNAYPTLDVATGYGCDKLPLSDYIATTPDTCIYDRFSVNGDLDSFKACVQLSNASDSEAALSSTRCNGDTGATSSITNRFCVCSK